MKRKEMEARAEKFNRTGVHGEPGHGLNLIYVWDKERAVDFALQQVALAAERCCMAMCQFCADGYPLRQKGGFSSHQYGKKWLHCRAAAIRAEFGEDK